MSQANYDSDALIVCYHGSDKVVPSLVGPNADEFLAHLARIPSVKAKIPETDVRNWKVDFYDEISGQV